MRRAEPHVTTLIQHGLIAQGFPLPQFGADGHWESETQRAYDAYVAQVEGRPAPRPSGATEPGPINVIVDLSHHNRVSDFQTVKNDGIAGILHKATQGVRFTDPRYASRRTRALEAGLLWGSYHFGVGGDPEGQAEHFLSTVQPMRQDLLVLDLEDNPQGATMTLDEAEDFVDFIHAETGRWPGLYSGHFIKEKLGNRTDTILANCWLWLAQYGSRAKVPPAWVTWTLWQYTDGAVGPEPHTVEGIGHCDRDTFNGNAEELQHFWRGEG
jgi:lysozyme